MLYSAGWAGPIAGGADFFRPLTHLGGNRSVFLDPPLETSRKENSGNCNASCLIEPELNGRTNAKVRGMGPIVDELEPKSPTANPPGPHAAKSPPPPANGRTKEYLVAAEWAARPFNEFGYNETNGVKTPRRILSELRQRPAYRRENVKKAVKKGRVRLL